MVRGPLFHAVIFAYWEVGANRAHDNAHDSNKGTAHDTHATHNMCVLIIFLFSAARDGTPKTAVGASAAATTGAARDGVMISAVGASAAAKTGAARDDAATTAIGASAATKTGGARDGAATTAAGAAAATTASAAATWPRSRASRTRRRARRCDQRGGEDR